MQIFFFIFPLVLSYVFMSSWSFIKKNTNYFFNRKTKCNLSNRFCTYMKNKAAGLSPGRVWLTFKNQANRLVGFCSAIL